MLPSDNSSESSSSRGFVYNSDNMENKKIDQAPDQDAAVYEKEFHDTRDAKAPPPLVGVFHPSIFPIHIQILKKSVLLLLLLITLVMAILSIFWGSMHHRSRRLHNIKVWVLDFDQDIVGPSLVDFIQPYVGIPTNLGYEIIKSSDYKGSIDTVFHDIHDEQAWAAIAIAPNATQVLTDAVANGESIDSSYLVQFVYNPARMETVTYNYMFPAINNMSSIWSKKFATEWVHNISSTLSASNISRLASNAPGLLAEPVTFTFVPVTNYHGDIVPAILVTGLIYLIIVSFFEIPHFAGIHMSVLTRVKFLQAMLHRPFLNMCAMFILSLAFSLVSLGFGQDFSAKYGRGGFVVYWMINFMAMWALGGASENMVSSIMVVFMPAMGYWLIFWVAINAATSFSPLELSPGIYKIGLVLPVHNAQQAIRTVLFNTKSHMAINFAVFTVWVVINFFFSFVSIAFIRWWKGREAKKAAQAGQVGA